MRYVVRTLGWTINILWIMIIAFTGTAIYSALNLRMGFGQPQVFSSDSLLILSFPLTVNNTSYYDLSELNSTVNVMDPNGSISVTSTAFVPLIRQGSNIKTAHNMSLDLNDFIQRSSSYLFNDTTFDVNLSLKLTYAYAFTFGFSQNSTITWGAPLYNFSIRRISYQPYNSTHQRAVISLGFDNHSSYLSIDGEVQLEIYNSTDGYVGSGTTNINVPPHSSFDSQMEVLVDISELTGSGTLHFYFETVMFSFGPLVMSYG